VIGICLLAGGEATRLPGKLNLATGDVPLLARVYRNLASGRPTVVSVRAPLDAFTRGLIDDAECVLDRWPQRGPLSGLLSAMSALRTPWVFAAAGDAPFLDTALIDALAAEISDDIDAVVPVHGERARMEPLAALYRREAFLREGLPVLLEGDAGVRTVIGLLRTRQVAYEDERLFTNINTAADFAAVREAFA
jgi:molybdopterin-guanine dinucleotide biosynthesis protein A